jgi:hypothetical protein
VIVEVEPVRETSLAFQIDEIVEGSVMLTTQLETAAGPVFFTRTAPVNPDPQSESMRDDAVIAAKAWEVERTTAKAAMRTRWSAFFIIALDSTGRGVPRSIDSMNRRQNSMKRRYPCMRTSRCCGIA